MKKRQLKLLAIFVILLLGLRLFFLKKNNSALENTSLENWKTTAASPFRKEQMKFERVQKAYAAKEIFIKKLLTSKGIHSFDYDLFLRIFKKEEILEVWVKAKTAHQYQLLITYPFCKNSGTLGPKRKEGDRQIPEGFYRISHFNPNSNFLLSLKVNYPNDSDKILGNATHLGSDIYLHGGCQTVGCVPITNDKIQELYLLAVESHEVGKTIPVHIFPTKNWTTILSKKSIHLDFWKNIKVGFDFFEKNKILPKMNVNDEGKYY